MEGFSCVYFSDFSTEQINTSFRATCSITIKPKGFADRDEVQGNPFLTAIFANHYTKFKATMIKIESTTTPGTLGLLNPTTSFVMTITDETNKEEVLAAIAAMEEKQSNANANLYAAVIAGQEKQAADARRSRRLIRTFGFLGLFLLLAIGVGLAALGVQNYIGQQNQRLEFMRVHGSIVSSENEVKRDLGTDIYLLKAQVMQIPVAAVVNPLDSVVTIPLDSAATVTLDSATLIQTAGMLGDSTLNQQ